MTEQFYIDDYKKKEARIVTTTKPLVDWLLALNTNNRNPKKGHIAWIKQSIDEGKFILTGQGIGISEDGRLIDGQHRLMAIRDAGYPEVELLIVTGLDERARIYIDQNAKRSTADMLKIVLNDSITTRMSSVIRTHLTLKEEKIGFMFGSRKPPLDDVVDTMSEHHGIIASIIEAAGHKARAGITTALFHYAIKYNEEYAIQFAQQIRDGVNLLSTDPAYRLREHIYSQKGRYGGQGLQADYKYTVFACVADANREEVKGMRLAESWNGLPSSQKRTIQKLGTPEWEKSNAQTKAMKTQATGN